jgi:hypothetical protein
VVGKVSRRPADKWRGDDGRTHFKSVQHDGIAIHAYDFVEVLGEDPSTDSARVAYVEDLVQAEGEDVLLEVRWLEPAGVYTSGQNWLCSLCQLNFYNVVRVVAVAQLNSQDQSFRLNTLKTILSLHHFKAALFR